MAGVQVLLCPDCYCVTCRTVMLVHWLPDPPVADPLKPKKVYVEARCQIESCADFDKPRTIEAQFVDAEGAP